MDDERPRETDAALTENKALHEQLEKQKAACAELQSDKAVILDRLRAACEMLLAKGDAGVFNVLTGNGAHVPEVRRDVLADNARLRALIKDIEFAIENRTDEGLCVWCRTSSLHGTHDFDCPAFMPTGEVR